MMSHSRSIGNHTPKPIMCYFAILRNLVNPNIFLFVRIERGQPVLDILPWGQLLEHIFVHSEKPWILGYSQTENLFSGIKFAAYSVRCENENFSGRILCIMHQLWTKLQRSKARVKQIQHNGSNRWPPNGSIISSLWEERQRNFLYPPCVDANEGSSFRGQ